MLLNFKHQVNLQIMREGVLKSVFQRLQSFSVKVKSNIVSHLLMI